jgi:transcriptional regulator with XRE-family HTH domain
LPVVGQASPESLVGNVYEGVIAGRGVDPFVVVKDPPGEHVWIENVEGAPRLRRVQRKRLLSYRYRFVGRREPQDRAAPVITPPPVFDGPGFAGWLERWLATEGLTAKELAERAGVSASMIHDLLHGHPRRYGTKGAPKRMTPGINMIAAIAHGLDYEFSYVAARAGFPGGGDRWRNFSLAERIALAILLGAEDEDHLDQALDALVEPQKVGVTS